MYLHVCEEICHLQSVRLQTICGIEKRNYKMLLTAVIKPFAWLLNKMFFAFVTCRNVQICAININLTVRFPTLCF